MKTGTDVIGLDHNLIITDTAAKVAMTLTEAIPSQITGTTENITGVIHDTHTQVLMHIILTMTVHTTNHLHTGAHQLTQEITADHALSQPTGQLRKPHTNLHQGPEEHKVRHTKRNSRVTIDDPQRDFYSSDDHSSVSEEDSDHLN